MNVSSHNSTSKGGAKVLRTRCTEQHTGCRLTEIQGGQGYMMASGCGQQDSSCTSAYHKEACCRESTGQGSRGHDSNEMETHAPSIHGVDAALDRHFMPAP